MKKVLYLLIFVVMIGLAQAGPFSGTYSGTYFDAVVGADQASSNTWVYDTVTYPTLSSWENGGSAIGKWWDREGYGESVLGENAVLGANNSSATVGDCPMLVTTIPNLVPDVLYDVYVTFISSTSLNWMVKAGLSPASLEDCLSSNSTVTGTEAGGRSGYEHFLGRTEIDGSGNIEVYIDDHGSAVSSGDRTWYDGVVYRVAGPYDPSISQSMNPSDIDVTLSWKAAPGVSSEVSSSIKKHYVYVSGDINADPNLAAVSYVGEVVVTDYDDPNASFGTIAMNYAGMYNWQIEEGIDNGSGGVYPPGDAGNILGPVWQFETFKRIPEITDHPDDVLAADSDVVEFVVDVITPFPESYQWYKSSDSLVGGDTTTGTNSNTLSVVAGSGTEAWYYVVVTNAEGDATSDVVGLWLEKEVGRWKLNNDLTDATGNGWTGGWAGLAGGFDAQAIEGTHSLASDSDPNHLVVVSGSEDYFSHYVVGLTASCWVKTDSPVSSTMGIISKQALSSLSPDPAQGWTIRSNSNGTASFIVRRAPVAISSTDRLDDGTWHMITAVYDPSGGNARLYFDGLLAGTESSITPDVVEKTPNDIFVIGGDDAHVDGNPRMFKGLIDDVRVFTYPMTSTDVADLYLEHVSDATICIDSTNPAMDFNNNCKSDIEDYAIFAIGWLECNLYPVVRCDE